MKFSILMWCIIIFSWLNCCHLEYVNFYFPIKLFDRNQRSFNDGDERKIQWPHHLSISYRYKIEKIFSRLEEHLSQHALDFFEKINLYETISVFFNYPHNLHFLRFSWHHTLLNRSHLIINFLWMRHLFDISSTTEVIIQINSIIGWFR